MLIFACVNFFKLKENRSPPLTVLEFDIIYSEKREGRDKKTYIFSPLHPKPISWDEFESRLSTMQGGSALLPQARHGRTVTRNVQGVDGVSCFTFPSVLGVIPGVAPWFITNQEIDTIEVRDDWRSYMYTLMKDA
jgi:hypothetical protein